MAKVVPPPFHVTAAKKGGRQARAGSARWPVPPGVYGTVMEGLHGCPLELDIWEELGNSHSSPYFTDGGLGSGKGGEESQALKLVNCRGFLTLSQCSSHIPRCPR